MAEQLLPVAALYFLSYAIGLVIPTLLLLPLLPLTQFFARIPISLSGFGLQEGLFMSFFSLINLSPTSSFLLGLASNLGNIIFSLPGAYFYLFGSRGREPEPSRDFRLTGSVPGPAIPKGRAKKNSLIFIINIHKLEHSPGYLFRHWPRSDFGSFSHHPPLQ